MANLSAHNVRDVIIDRLSSGVYPLGGKLPTARELAAELGVHRNTVAKVYRWLEELGLVTLRQGRGTYVAALVGDENRLTVSDQLSGTIADLVRKARRLGIPEEQLRRIVDGEITAIYQVRPRRAAFVECNTADLAAAVDEIEALTGVRLATLLLDDLRSDPDETAERYEVVVTSLFHVNEVSDLLAPLLLKPALIGVYTQPDEQALGAIARIRPDARVGIVCNTAPGGERFAKQITTFTAVTTKTAVKPSDDQIRRLAAEVEVIVCSRSRTAQVRGLDLAIPVIPLPFHVSPQAVGRIVEALGVGQELAVAI